MIDAIKRIYSVPVINVDTASDGKRTRYSNSDVKQAIALFNKLKTYGGVEKELGVSRNTVRLWVKKHATKSVMKNVDDVYSAMVNKRLSKGANKLNKLARQDKLVELVVGKSLNTDTIVDLLGVTAATVRNDMIELISNGRIKDVSDNPYARLVVAA